jgi:hypothetical protein
MNENSLTDNISEPPFDLPSSLKKKIQSLDDVETFFRSDDVLQQMEDSDLYMKKLLDPSQWNSNLDFTDPTQISKITKNIDLLRNNYRSENSIGLDKSQSSLFHQS